VWWLIFRCQMRSRYGYRLTSWYSTNNDSSFSNNYEGHYGHYGSHGHSFYGRLIRTKSIYGEK
jgi:hypothetical protein